jgi:hypothetical protein
MSDIERLPKKSRLLVLLDAQERAMLERLAAQWGVSLAGAVRRLIRESPASQEPRG